MSSLQKILRAVGFLILFTFLFPPFESVHPSGGVQNAGYSFILLPPKGAWGLCVVDIGMLLMEWAVIFLLAGILWILTAVNEVEKHDAQKQADYESLIAKTDEDKLELAKKFDMGEIGFVGFKQQEIVLDRMVQEQLNKRMKENLKKRVG